MLEKEGASIIVDAISGSNVSKLHLYNSKILPEGAIELSPHLKKYTNLQDLDMSWCSLGKDGVITIVESIMYFQLQKLFLRANNIGEEGTIILSKYLKNFDQLTHLIYSENNMGK